MRTCNRETGLVKQAKDSSLEEGRLRHWEWHIRSRSGRREYGEYTERGQWERGRRRRVKWGLVPNKDRGVEGVHSIC